MNHWPRTVLRATVHLLWLSCLIVPLVTVLSVPDPWLALGGIALVAVACAVTLPDGKLWPFAAAILVSIPLVAPVHPHAWPWIGGIAAGFAPLLCHGVQRWLAALAAVALSAAVGLLHQSPFLFAMITVAVGSTVLAMAGLPVWFATLLDQARAGREAQSLLAVSEERLRFARDVHDLLGHRLTVIALKSELAGRLAPSDPARAASEAFAAQQLASSALSEVRAAVDGYRAVDLDSQLVAVQNVLQDAGIRCSVASSPVPAAVATQLALVAREACTNVLRHSTATWCKISVEVSAGEARMTVANDGASSAVLGNGLRGTAERLSLVGGGLDVRCASGEFTLTVVVPT